jgi:hypothetical protein
MNKDSVNPATYRQGYAEGGRIRKVVYFGITQGKNDYHLET